MTQPSETTNCSHCGKPKPAQSELCPHCQRRGVVPSTYQRPRLIPTNAIKEEADGIIGLVIAVVGIALVAFVIFRFVSC